MSLGVRHSMLFVALIHVASLGADQLSLGTTFPPSSAMVANIASWIPGHSREGSESSSSPLSSSDEPVGVELAEKMPLSVSVEVRGSAGEGFSGGRIMPSARR